MDKTQNPNVVRVALGTGYNPVEENRRASRNGRVGEIPHPKIPTKFANFCSCTWRNHTHPERAWKRLNRRQRCRGPLCARDGGPPPPAGDHTHPERAWKRLNRRQRRRGPLCARDGGPPPPAGDHTHPERAWKRLNRRQRRRGPLCARDGGPPPPAGDRCGGATGGL
jgi:hypothetical protein